MQPTATTQLTTQQMADRLGLTTAELSELRLKDDDLPIERDGFKLYYRLDTVRAFEQREMLNLIQRVMASDQPLVILKRMAEASGLPKVRIAGQLIQARKPSIDPAPEQPPEPTPKTHPEPKPQTTPEPAPEHTRTLDTTHPWYVVHTKPRQETVALENLKRQGYTCYLPTMRVKKPRGCKLIESEEPMFPRYLFISIDSDFRGKGWSPIRSTRGVHEMVRFGADPTQIHVDLLNAIFAREREQRRHPEQPFKPGDRVRVVDGPLAGIESLYEAETGEERSMILLKLLNRPVKVQIATAQLRKTG
jgi:transcriptional antiterminator RfaH